MSDHATCTRWVLVLNKYQRDNLLYLLASVGWGIDEREPPDTPVSRFNTGDWVGEIGQMIVGSLGTPTYAHSGQRYGEEFPGPIRPNPVYRGPR